MVVVLMDKVVCVVDIEGNAFIEKSDCCDHRILYQRIIQQRGLEFEGYLDKNGHQLALYLTTLGDLTITRENWLDVFYLGEYISTKQVQWFKREKKMFDC